MQVIPKVKIKSGIPDQTKIVFQQSTVTDTFIGGYRRYLQKLHHKISGLKLKISQADKITITGLESCQGAFHSFYTALHDVFLQNTEMYIRSFNAVIFSRQNGDDTARTKRLQGGELVVLLAKCAVLPKQTLENFFQADTSFLSNVAATFYSSIMFKLQ
jgi:hypothetical protein